MEAKAIVQPENLFYMKQNIANACGTIALIHAVANSNIELGGMVKTFLDKCQGKSYQERADLLGEETSFSEAHESVANAGITAVEPNVMHHYIALVEHEGTVYELDGRKSYPISHGPVSSAGFTKECARICKEFMARDPEDVRFNIMALTGV